MRNAFCPAPGKALPGDAIERQHPCDACGESDGSQCVALSRWREAAVITKNCRSMARFAWVWPQRYPHQYRANAHERHAVHLIAFALAFALAFAFAFDRMNSGGL